MEYIIVGILTVVIFFFMDDDKVWVVVKDGEEYKPILKHRSDLTEGEEYSTNYPAAFKEARRKNFWFK